MSEYKIGEIYTRNRLENSARVERDLLVYKTQNKTVKSGNFNEQYKITDIIVISDCQVYDYMKNTDCIGLYNHIVFAEKVVIEEKNVVDISNMINNFYEEN